MYLFVYFFHSDHLICISIIIGAGPSTMWFKFRDFFLIYEAVPESKVDGDPMLSVEDVEDWPPANYDDNAPLQIPFGPATAAKWTELSRKVKFLLVFCDGKLNNLLFQPVLANLEDDKAIQMEHSETLLMQFPSSFRYYY